MDQGAAAAPDGGRDSGADPSAAGPGAPREPIVTGACRAANCARTGANGGDQPLNSLAASPLAGIYAFSFDQWAQLPGRRLRVVPYLRLGRSQLAFQRFDTPAPAS